MKLLRKLHLPRSLLENSQLGDSGDEDNLQDEDDVQEKTNDDEEESRDEFVHTPPNYVPTNDETNDETNDVDEEEYDRINEELYGDVNVRFTDVEQDDGGEGDAKMTDATQIATTELPHISSSRSVSSTFTNAFLNLENLHYTKTGVISMFNIDFQHEVLRTSPLLTIPVFVIPEKSALNPSDIVTTTPATTISFLPSSLFPTLQQITPILTPITTEAITSTLKHSANIIKEYSIPADIVERLRKQYVPQKKKKRKPDDVGKDEDPSARSSRGLKRQRTSKGTETPKNTSISKDSSKGKSPGTFSKSGKSVKDQVEEPIFVQDSDDVEHDDT
ncbi:hypothetical protein Tco_1242948 [Tanacetum coccineum]